MVQGIERIRLLDWIGDGARIWSRASRRPPDQTAPGDGGGRAAARRGRYLPPAGGRSSAELPDELAAAAENLTDPRQRGLLRRVGGAARRGRRARSSSRWTRSTAKLRRLVDLLQRELAVRELGRKITTETEERLTKEQREYYLREQLRSIQRELGEDGGTTASWPSCAGGSRRRACPRRRGARRSASWAGWRASRRPRRSTASSAPTSTGWRACPGTSWPAATIDIAPGPRGAGRGPLRPGEDQGPHPRVPGRQEAAGRSGRPSGRRSWRGSRARRAAARNGDSPRARADPAASSGRPGVGKTSLGQIIARALGPQVRRACRWAACATRRRSAATGGRTSARCPAASSRRCGAPRRAIRSSCSTRSTRSARTGAAIRPRRCWRCSIRRRTTPSSTTTSGVPFDLSQVLFIATANTLDTIPGPAARPHGDPAALRLHRRGEGRDRPAVSGPEAARRPRPRRRTSCPFEPEAHPPDRARVHARGRRAEPGAARSPRSPGRWPAGWPRGRREPVRITADSVVGVPRPAALLRRGGRAHRPARAWPPAWPGRRPAATSCSSRRR